MVIFFVLRTVMIKFTRWFLQTFTRRKNMSHYLDVQEFSNINDKGTLFEGILKCYNKLKFTFSDSGTPDAMCLQFKKQTTNAALRLFCLGKKTQFSFFQLCISYWFTLSYYSFLLYSRQTDKRLGKDIDLIRDLILIIKSQCHCTATAVFLLLKFLCSSICI